MCLITHAIYMKLKILSLISRWWQNFGFGIQSKTDFAFLHDVIKEKLPYYAYDDIGKAFPNASKSEIDTARLFYRLGNYIHPSKIINYGLVSDINLYALNLTLQKGTDKVLTEVDEKIGKRILCVVEGEGSNEVLSSLHNVSLLLMSDIQGINKDLWQQVCSCNTVTYDKRNIGIALFQNNRYSEHYYIL